ncbi:MAG: hypothetical protein ACIAQZ_15070 [Sedimentisphaeraceae bacterium JB056]
MKIVSTIKSWILSHFACFVGVLHVFYILFLHMTIEASSDGQASMDWAYAGFLDFPISLVNKISMRPLLWHLTLGTIYFIGVTYFYHKILARINDSVLKHVLFYLLFCPTLCSWLYLLSYNTNIKVRIIIQSMLILLWLICYLASIYKFKLKAIIYVLAFPAIVYFLVRDLLLIYISQVSDYESVWYEIFYHIAGYP